MDGLERLGPDSSVGSGRVPLTAFKLPHHGSAKNLSEALIRKVDCQLFLISTDGSGRPRHPDHLAILRILRNSRRPTLMFNYECETTRDWRDRRDEAPELTAYDFETIYPDPGKQGLVADLD
jgi:hypothetical protein